MVKSEFNYELTQSFNYAHKGNQEEAQFVTFKAPTLKNAEVCSKIKQIFTRAFIRNSNDQAVRQDGIEAGDDTEPTGDLLIQLLYASNESAAEVFDLFTDILRTDRALIDGEVKFTSSLLDSLSLDEIEKMAGQYFLNFILASLLQ